MSPTSPIPIPILTLSKHLRTLRTSNYKSADICDALLSLNVTHSGFLADLHLRNASTSPTYPLVALASTIRFAPKFPPPVDAKLPGHPADLCTAPSDSLPEPRIAVIKQPYNQRCAVLGGLVALRLQKRGIVGAVIHGRARDIGELPIPVWSKGVSCVGAGAETVPVEVGGEVEMMGVVVDEGDVVFADEEGVVVIPIMHLEQVVKRLPGLGERDAKVLEEVKEGMALGSAIKKWRK
ncbi:RraA-like protein [Ascodesmis nigricans]|uniref:RraA-like protein n=1 Tax=Ascodesmis nigricans TaxID=341454 RepID=A0A4V3SJ04_9PEZI|nr:RraA-like protein [Ascodesmis nigricans]